MRQFRASHFNANGFTFLELVVVIALIGMLISIALSKLAGYVEEAERVAVLNVEGRLRNALVLETAQRILDSARPGLVELERSNPMRLMLETPYNYAGELAGGAAANVQGRHWYFDRDERELVYRRGGRLPADGQRDIRYRVRVAFHDRDGDGVFAASRDELLGVRLLRLN